MDQPASTFDNNDLSTVQVHIEQINGVKRSFFFTLIFFIERTKLLYICVQELLEIKRRLAVVILFKGFNTQGFDVGMIYISL